MPQRRRVGCVVAAGILTAVLLASRASAYCRATATQFRDSPELPSQCDRDGTPLAWVDRDIVLRLHPVFASSDLAPSEVRTALADAFAAWERVSCDGDATGVHLYLDDMPAVESRAMRRSGGLNENTLLFFTPIHWATLGHDPGALAITTTWFDAATGAIDGADIEINEGLTPFAICPAEGCDPSAGRKDFPSVITHELGHLLGLAHSVHEDATMYFRANAWETKKRTLSEDDAAGLCAAYGPDAEPPRVERPFLRSGCSVVPADVAPRHGRLLLLWLAACAAWSLLRARLRRARGGTELARTD